MSVRDEGKGVIAMSLRTLHHLLSRAANGEDPDMIVLEELANANRCDITEWVATLKTANEGGEHE